MAKAIGLVISDEIVTLNECPIGLFVIESTGTLCLKTEYKNNDDGIDCYIVSTGEYLLCEGKTKSFEGCELILVRPASFDIHLTN